MTISAPVMKRDAGALPGLLDFFLMRVPNVYKFGYNFNF